MSNLNPIEQAIADADIAEQNEFWKHRNDFNEAHHRVIREAAEFRARQVVELATPLIYKDLSDKLHAICDNKGHSSDCLCPNRITAVQIDEMAMELQAHSTYSNPL